MKNTERERELSPEDEFENEVESYSPKFTLNTIMEEREESNG